MHAPLRVAPARAPFVAVAGLSARLFTESALRGGLNVAALDVFGDRDTRQRARLWLDIGGAPLAVDPDKLFEALARVARLPRMLGFIAGSGLEPFAASLHDRPRLPRLIGNDAHATAAVRTPQRFFALLDELGVAHPPVSFMPPAQPEGWLGKRADGCGGTHIRPAADLTAAPDYFQRIGSGRAMSALFIAARGSVRIVGFAEQLTVALGAMPYVHAGSLGPIDLPPQVAAQIDGALQAIVARTGLVGMNSLDFLLDGERISVLEINARPSSSAALYELAAPAAWPHGLLAAHIDACLKERLPPAPSASGETRYAAQRVAFAPSSFTVSQRFSDALFAASSYRDVPLPGTTIPAGAPVCTVIVSTSTAAALHGELERQHAHLLELIDTCRESHDDFIT
jgi:predicted ATP-grasp superfamily ATP-dependent carboligase